MFMNLTSKLELPPKGPWAYGTECFALHHPTPAQVGGKIPERGFAEHIPPAPNTQAGVSIFCHFLFKPIDNWLDLCSCHFFWVPFLTFSEDWNWSPSRETKLVHSNLPRLQLLLLVAYPRTTFSENQLLGYEI